MRLGIIAPEGKGLRADQGYLPALIQGVLVTNISKYSAISVLDRISLDRVIAETLDPTYEDSFDIVTLGHVAQVGYMLTGSLTRASAGYSLQLNVTDTTPNAKTKASYSQIHALSQLEDMSALQSASIDLLTQMGVRLTPAAIAEIKSVASRVVNANIALAQGVVAQGGGSYLEAFSYILKAKRYDPHLIEASERYSILESDILNGGVSTNVRSDIEWRKQWVALLKEVETYCRDVIKNSFYYLVYDPVFEQDRIHYDSETVDLSFEVNLLPDAGWVNALNNLVSVAKLGLKSTGRAKAWGLDWPLVSIDGESPFVSYKQSHTIDIALLNGASQHIGACRYVVSYASIVDDGIFVFPWVKGRAVFLGIPADSLTNLLSLQVTAVDGVAVASQSKLSILPVAEYNAIPEVVAAGMDINNLSRFSLDSTGFKISDYSGPPGKLIIPPIANGFTVDPLFRMIFTFANKNITSVVIPSTFSSLHGNPFDRDPLDMITLGTGVAILDSPAIITPIFDRDFIRLYNANHKQAGTYTRNGNTWTYLSR
jgi:hypothetical protein